MSYVYTTDASGYLLTFSYVGFPDISSYKPSTVSLSSLTWTDLSGYLKSYINYLPPPTYYFNSISGLFSGYTTISSSINLAVSGNYTNNFSFLTSSNYITPKYSFKTISSYIFSIPTNAWLNNTTYNQMTSFYLNGTIDTSGGNIIVRQGSLYVNNTINDTPVSYITALPTLSSNNNYQNLFMSTLSSNVNSYYYQNGATDNYQSLYLSSISSFLNYNYYQIGALQNSGVGSSYLPLAGGTMTGLLKFNNSGNEMIDLGFGDSTREMSAGKIAYGPGYDSNSLTIVGKGTTNLNRSIHMYDSVIIEKGLNVYTNLTVQGSLINGYNSLYLTSLSSNLNTNYYQNGATDNYQSLYLTSLSNTINAFNTSNFLPLSGGKTITGNLGIDTNYAIYFRGLSDPYHYMKFDLTYDGPKIAGYSGGCLSSSMDGDILSWDKNKVQINTNLNVQGSIINSYNSLYLTSLSNTINAFNTSNFLPKSGGAFTGDVWLSSNKLCLRNYPTSQDKLVYDATQDGPYLSATTGGALGINTTYSLSWASSGVTINQGNLKTTNGQVIINESTGTDASTTNGSLVIKHGNSGGASSIVFPSASNSGSDCGYIRFLDNYNGTSGEASKLVIGIENDPSSASGPDCIAIMACSNFGSNVATGSVLINKLTPTGNTNTYSLDIAGHVNIDGNLNIGGQLTFPVGFDITGNISLTGTLYPFYFVTTACTITLPSSTITGTKITFRNKITSSAFTTTVKASGSSLYGWATGDRSSTGLNFNYFETFIYYGAWWQLEGN
jgi:hypothetical protein